MKQAEMKIKQLKKRTGHEALGCTRCNEIGDFCLTPNGDVECAYCGDVKGNISNTQVKLK